MALCSATPKVILGIFTAIFWAAAAGLIFIGVWVYMEYKHYEQLGEAVYTLIPATIIMALGVFFFVLGMIGCIGAFKEQRCMLGVYFTILLVILVGMVITAALGYVYRQEVHTKVEHGIKKGMNHYGQNDSTITSEIDFMQSHLHCCGLHNYTDWLETPWYTEQKKNATVPYPTSCCVQGHCNYSKPYQNDTSLYHKGCHDQLKKTFLDHLAVIAITAATFVVIMVIGMVSSCVLICRKRDDNPYLGLTSPDHMRV